jgi:bacillithiol synthase
MPTDCITYQDSGYFSKLIIDYLNEKTALQSLYNRFPKIDNFKAQIEEKKNNFDNQNRTILVNALQKQYASFDISEPTQKNISLLEKNTTFTVTTGHQLNLFTGPLYFLYKIISTINLCKELKDKYPDCHFVPIYWMATEDHDFEEINHFTVRDKKMSWNVNSSGPVGRLKLDSIDELFADLSHLLGTGENASYLKKLFSDSYLQHQNLAEATRFLVNELFKNKGLVILDGDDKDLKKIFAPYAKSELVSQNSFKQVTDTTEKLKAYFIQVNPREINLFYIENNLRERIIYEDDVYKINNTKLTFSREQMLEIVEKTPEKLSPNVILRPLYQEVILPNLCYIGGGGEMAYWLELKSNFEANKITFPVLLVRNSGLLASAKQNLKAEKLHLTWKDLFGNQQELFDRKAKEISIFTIDFTEQKNHLKNQFEALHVMALQTDKSFLGAVIAQETKQMRGLDNLEKRLLKAEKRVHKNELERIVNIQNELFPEQSLQERTVNFAEFYLDYGPDLIEKLFDQLKPLEQKFAIIIL